MRDLKGIHKYCSKKWEGAPSKTLLIGSIVLLSLLWLYFFLVLKITNIYISLSILLILLFFLLKVILRMVLFPGSLRFVQNGIERRIAQDLLSFMKEYAQDELILWKFLFQKNTSEEGFHLLERKKKNILLARQSLEKKYHSFFALSKSNHFRFHPDEKILFNILSSWYQIQENIKIQISPHFSAAPPTLNSSKSSHNIPNNLEEVPTSSAITPSPEFLVSDSESPSPLPKIVKVVCNQEPIVCSPPCTINNFLVLLQESSSENFLLLLTESVVSTSSSIESDNTYSQLQSLLIQWRSFVESMLLRHCSSSNSILQQLAKNPFSNSLIPFGNMDLIRQDLLFQCNGMAMPINTDDGVEISAALFLAYEKPLRQSLSHAESSPLRGQDTSNESSETQLQLLHEDSNAAFRKDYKGKIDGHGDISELRGTRESLQELPNTSESNGGDERGHNVFMGGRVISMSKKSIGKEILKDERMGEGAFLDSKVVPIIELRNHGSRQKKLRSSSLHHSADSGNSDIPLLRKSDSSIKQLSTFEDTSIDFPPTLGLFHSERNIIDALFKENTRANRSCVLFCNPNASYFELNSEYIGFYRSHGVDVLAYNYRGYAKSGGWPSIDACKRDGEALMKKILALGYTNIGVHGRSIGGVIACHVAKKYSSSIKWLCVDRTFNSLECVATCTIGKMASFALRLTKTGCNSVENYISCLSENKIILSDPKDTLIVELSSLRSGIANYFGGFDPCDVLPRRNWDLMTAKQMNKRNILFWEEESSVYEENRARREIEQYRGPWRGYIEDEESAFYGVSVDVYDDNNTSTCCPSSPSLRKKLLSSPHRKLTMALEEQHRYNKLKHQGKKTERKEGAREFLKQRDLLLNREKYSWFESLRVNWSDFLGRSEDTTREGRMRNRYIFSPNYIPLVIPETINYSYYQIKLFLSSYLSLEVLLLSSSNAFTLQEKMRVWKDIVKYRKHDKLCILGYQKKPTACVSSSTTVGCANEESGRNNAQTIAFNDESWESAIYYVTPQVSLPADGCIERESNPRITLDGTRRSNYQGVDPTRSEKSFKVLKRCLTLIGRILPAKVHFLLHNQLLLSKLIFGSNRRLYDVLRSSSCMEQQAMSLLSNLFVYGMDEGPEDHASEVLNILSSSIFRLQFLELLKAIGEKRNEIKTTGKGDKNKSKTLVESVREIQISLQNFLMECLFTLNKKYFDDLTTEFTKLFNECNMAFQVNGDDSTDYFKELMIFDGDSYNMNDIQTENMACHDKLYNGKQHQRDNLRHMEGENSCETQGTIQKREKDDARAISERGSSLLEEGRKISSISEERRSLEVFEEKLDSRMNEGKKNNKAYEGKKRNVIGVTPSNEKEIDPLIKKEKLSSKPQLDSNFSRNYGREIHNSKFLHNEGNNRSDVISNEGKDNIKVTNEKISHDTHDVKAALAFLYCEVMHVNKFYDTVYRTYQFSLKNIQTEVRKKVLGSAIRLRNGHNGLLSCQESKMLSHHLMASDLIPTAFESLPT